MIGILNRKKFNLPDGMDLIELDNKLRFKGTADQIDRLSSEILKIAELKKNQKYKLGKFIFSVSDTIPTDFDLHHVRILADAWKIMSLKFREVANSWESSPFDFNDCGYLDPKLEFNLGVELVGEPNPR